MEIVGHQGTLPERSGVDQRQERSEVLGLGSLPDHDLHPQAQLFPGLRQLRALVIGADSGTDIGVEVFPRQERGMTIHNGAVEGGEFGQHGGVGIQDPGKVHHLRQPDNSSFCP